MVKLIFAIICWHIEPFITQCNLFANLCQCFRIKISNIISPWKLAKVFCSMATDWSPEYPVSRLSWPPNSPSQTGVGWSLSVPYMPWVPLCARHVPYLLPHSGRCRHLRLLGGGWPCQEGSHCATYWPGQLYRHLSIGWLFRKYGLKQVLL